jgi:hypothetical protein
MNKAKVALGIALILVGGGLMFYVPFAAPHDRNAPGLHAWIKQLVCFVVSAPVLAGGMIIVRKFCPAISLKPTTEAYLATFLVCVGSLPHAILFVGSCFASRVDPLLFGILDFFGKWCFWHLFPFMPAGFFAWLFAISACRRGNGLAKGLGFFSVAILTLHAMYALLVLTISVSEFCGNPHNL